MEININKFKENAYLQATKTRKILWNLGSHAFLAIIIILLLELMCGGLLFYKYVFLTKKQESGVVSSSSEFKESAYQSILLSWQKREQNFQDYSKNDYSNPF